MEEIWDIIAGVGQEYWVIIVGVLLLVKITNTILKFLTSFAFLAFLYFYFYM